jgi:hypothetical protein
VPGWFAGILRLPWRPDLLAFGPRILGSLSRSNFTGILMFVLLAGTLFYFARKKLD